MIKLWYKDMFNHLVPCTGDSHTWLHKSDYIYVYFANDPAIANWLKGRDLRVWAGDLTERF